MCIPTCAYPASYETWTCADGVAAYIAGRCGIAQDHLTSSFSLQRTSDLISRANGRNAIRLCLNKPSILGSWLTSRYRFVHLYARGLSSNRHFDMKGTERT